MDARYQISLEVKFSEMCQTGELEAVKTLEFVVLQVKSSQCLQSVKSFVFNLLDVGVVEVEDT